MADEPCGITKESGHIQGWQVILAALGLTASIIWCVYLFTSSLSHDYVTAREYYAQIEDVKKLITETNVQLHEFRKDFADQINDRINDINRHFDQIDRRIGDKK